VRVKFLTLRREAPYGTQVNHSRVITSLKSSDCETVATSSVGRPSHRYAQFCTSPSQGEVIFARGMGFCFRLQDLLRIRATDRCGGTRLHLVAAAPSAAEPCGSRAVEPCGLRAAAGCRPGTPRADCTRIAGETVHTHSCATACLTGHTVFAYVGPRTTVNLPEELACTQPAEGGLLVDCPNFGG
jgi:hypothetical protein